MENMERGSGLMIQPGGTKGSILIGKITMVSHSRLRRGAEGGFLIGTKHCVGGDPAPPGLDLGVVWVRVGRVGRRKHPRPHREGGEPPPLRPNGKTEMPQV